MNSPTRNSTIFLYALLPILYSTVDLSAQMPVSEVTVLFEVGSAAISPSGDSTLGEFLREIELDQIEKIEIVAHTDAVGKLRYNEMLSKRRAESVRDWLTDREVDPGLGILSWKGEIDSLVSNATAQQRKLNRRAKVTAFAMRRMNPVEGSVLDSNEAGIDAQIVIRGTDFLDSTRTDSTGRFSLLAPDTAVLGIDVFAKGYVYASRMFKNDGRRTVLLNFKPTPIQSGVKFQLHRFYFVGNQSVLLKSSESELIRLLRFMTLNPTTVISIEGHINYPNNPRVSVESEHFDLSERRAKLVYDYLVDQKINPQRMSHEGFGNWNMVHPNARTEEMQKKNRRVEIRIVSQ
jgi:outer membrane protein OmpA-like peptidoglycan-associated protein